MSLEISTLLRCQISKNHHIFLDFFIIVCIQLGKIIRFP